MKKTAININVFPRVGTIKRPLITATMKREWTREDLMDAVGINGHYGGSRHVFRGTNQRHVLIGSSKRNRHAHPPHSTVANAAKTHPSLFTSWSPLLLFLQFLVHLFLSKLPLMISDWFRNSMNTSHALLSSPFPALWNSQSKHNMTGAFE